jgi:hypothetical protein
MRCLSCNVILTDDEATLRYRESKEFVDLCLDCISTIPDFEEQLDGNDIIYFQYNASTRDVQTDGEESSSKED